MSASQSIDTSDLLEVLERRIGCRSKDTFMIPDRKFTDDQIGVVSEATVDNGKVGLNATLHANTIIVNNRGMVQSLSADKLEPENILSFTALLMPACTNDDGKRKFVRLQRVIAVE